MTEVTHASSLTGEPYGAYAVMTRVNGHDFQKDTGMSRRGADGLKEVMELVHGVTCEIVREDIDGSEARA